MLAIIITILIAAAIWTFGFSCGVNIGTTLHTCRPRNTSHVELYDIEQHGGI